ncbi:MAG: hypothetical protein ABIG30_02275, partial [Candidatus Aenigmatarchaeota archaeon]
MRVTYKEGFMILKSGIPGPIFIAPHSSMSLVSLSRGDTCSELIASWLVKRFGGTAFISTIPRSGAHGVDFFREPASLKEAAKMFSNMEDHDARMQFERKYAFFSKDEEEYLEKANIYNQFWTSAKTLSPKGSLFVILHAQSMRMKNFPSLLDVITLDGKWINEDIVKEVVKNVNEKFASLFFNLNDDIKYYALSWAKIWLRNSILRSSNELVNVRGSLRENMELDIARACDILGIEKKFLKDITWNEYIGLIEKSMANTQFCVTYQRNFNGSKGAYTIKNLLDFCGGEAISLEL